MSLSLAPPTPHICWHVSRCQRSVCSANCREQYLIHTLMCLLHFGRALCFPANVSPGKTCSAIATPDHATLPEMGLDAAAVISRVATPHAHCRKTPTYKPHHYSAGRRQRCDQGPELSTQPIAQHPPRYKRSVAFHASWRAWSASCSYVERWMFSKYLPDRRQAATGLGTGGSTTRSSPPAAASSLAGTTLKSD